MLSAAVDVRVGLAGVLDRPAGLRPELQCQPLAQTRVHCEVDAVPVLRALRPEVRFERDVVLRAAVRGRLRHHQQRDRVAAAAGQPRILRGGDRELLVVPGRPQRVVGHLVPQEPPAVVGDLRRHARDHLLLQGDPPLPVALADAPAAAASSWFTWVMVARDRAEVQDRCRSRRGTRR